MAKDRRILEQSDQSVFFNVIPSPRDERDWCAEPMYDDVKRIPARMDWRGHLQRVRNQGRRGTSLAFVGTCILEWYSKKIQKTEITASPQFLFNSRPDKTQTLMSGRDLMETLRQSGCCKEESFVYGSSDAVLPEVEQDALLLKIDGYAKIRTMETLKRAILVNGPCLICFPVYNHTTKLWKQRKEQEKLGCHAMAVVGYNNKGFIVRNSWGEHWDTNGHCIYPYEDWGCHDEIWTVVNNDNIHKWKRRERNTFVKRYEILQKFFNTKAPDETEDISEDEDYVESELKNEALPEPRERIASSKESPNTASSGTLQGLIHQAEYQEFGVKEKVSGNNEMLKKKSLVSKMFGSQKKVPEIDLPSTESGIEESDVFQDDSDVFLGEEDAS